METNRTQFDGTRTKLSSRFMAGRGQALLQSINQPLQAQEFAKRRILREMLYKGQINLDMANIPDELLPENCINSSRKSLADDERPPHFPGGLQSYASTESSSNGLAQYNSKPLGSPTYSQSNGDGSGNDYTIAPRELKNASKPLRRPEKSKKKQFENDTKIKEFNAQDCTVENMNLSRTMQTSSEQGWQMQQLQNDVTSQVWSAQNNQHNNTKSSTVSTEWGQPQYEEKSPKTSGGSGWGNDPKQEQISGVYGWGQPQNAAAQQKISDESGWGKPLSNKKQLNLSGSSGSGWGAPQDDAQQQINGTGIWGQPQITNQPFQSGIVSSGWGLPQNNAHRTSKPEQLNNDSRSPRQVQERSNNIGWGQTQREVNRQSNGEHLPSQQQLNVKTKSPWAEWENNVIIDGSLEEEDLQQIATVEDNDDINDVVVNEYIDALQINKESDTKSHNCRKLTPQKVQQFSKLKSTSNADCVRPPPGTVPNPPKGDNRWGGGELNGVTPGWGDPVNNHRNNYDDGSSVWSSGGSQYGGLGWSHAS